MNKLGWEPRDTDSERSAVWLFIVSGDCIMLAVIFSTEICTHNISWLGLGSLVGGLFDGTVGKLGWKPRDTDSERSVVWSFLVLR